MIGLRMCFMLPPVLLTVFLINGLTLPYVLVIVLWEMQGRLNGGVREDDAAKSRGRSDDQEASEIGVLTKKSRDHQGPEEGEEERGRSFQWRDNHETIAHEVSSACRISFFG